MDENSNQRQNVQVTNETHAKLIALKNQTAMGNVGRIIEILVETIFLHHKTPHERTIALQEMQLAVTKSKEGL